MFESLGIEAAKRNLGENLEVVDKGLIDGPGTYQRRNTGLVSLADKKIANDQKSKHGKNKKKYH